MNCIPFLAYRHVTGEVGAWEKRFSTYLAAYPKLLALGMVVLLAGQACPIVAQTNEATFGHQSETLPDLKLRTVDLTVKLPQLQNQERPSSIRWSADDLPTFTGWSIDDLPSVSVPLPSINLLGLLPKTQHLDKNYMIQQVVPGSEGNRAVGLLATDRERLQLYIAAHSNAGCDAAATNLNDNSTLTGRLERPGRTPLSPAETALVTSFVSSCFSSPFSVHPGLGARAALLAVQVYSRLPDPVIYCSALIVDDDLVATARHCLFKDDGSSFGKNQISVIPLSGDKVRKLPAEIAPAYRLASGDLIWERNVGEDFILLRTTEPMGLDIEPLSFASDEDISTASSFLQMGYQVIATALTNTAPETIEQMRNGVLVDESAYCAVYRYSAECVVQGCQSLRQTSGAAFLIKSGDTLKLVGTLYGAPDKVRPDNRSCFPPDTPDSAASIVNISSRAK